MFEQAGPVPVLGGNWKNQGIFPELGIRTPPSTLVLLLSFGTPLRLTSKLGPDLITALAKLVGNQREIAEIEY